MLGFILIVNKLVLVPLYCPNEQWHGGGRQEFWPRATYSFYHTKISS